MILVPVKENDIKEVLDLQKKSFKDTYMKYKDDNTSPYLESIDSLEKKFNNPNNYFFFLKAYDKIGFIRVITNDDKSKGKISPIAILPKFQNLGYGSKAIRLVEKEFSSVKHWQLNTILEEEKLIQFYKKQRYFLQNETTPLNDKMTIVTFIKEI